MSHVNVSNKIYFNNYLPHNDTASMSTSCQLKQMYSSTRVVGSNMLSYFSIAPQMITKNFNGSSNMPTEVRLGPVYYL